MTKSSSSCLGALLLNHRSRERISSLGEVFTPQAYANKMLDLVSETHWADEQTNFFEPCCGIGSLLLPIFYRRVEFFEKKYVALGTSEPKIRAVANSIDTLWALDICEKNVETSRTLLFNAALDIVSNSQTIVRQSPVASRQSPVASRQSPVASLSKDFLAHLICSIAWQITQNETLSALGSEKDALKTATGIQWIQKNAHQPLDFFTSWSCAFRQKNKKNIAEVQFQRALYFLDLLENDNFVLQTKKTKDIQEFAFATGCKNLLGEMQHEKKSPTLINHASLQSAG